MIFNELFGRYLSEKGELTKAQAAEWIRKADENASPLSVELVKGKVLSEERTYIALAEYLGVEYRFCQLSEIDPKLAGKYSLERLMEFQAVPLSETSSALTLLCGNPFRFEELRALRFETNKKLKFVLSVPSQVGKILEYVSNKLQQVSVLSDYSATDTDITEADGELAIDAPVIKLGDSILKEAVSRGASDIHIEPFETEVIIRFRIDGRLNRIDTIPVHLYPALLARFKIMSNLNIAQRRLPQDGKISLTINETPYDFRVSTIPTIHGEKLVIRIYNIGFSNDDMETLGISGRQKELIEGLLSRPHGIILLTGPTGSGKSTTLYTFLRHLNKEDTNIITVEDPVENEIQGVNQIQVNPKAHLTFATALRSILRQDPNIIMIGEIRDEETAQIATRAAITGHLVLSSIHTNDAAGVVTRLIDMGVPKYLVADSLLGSISQRLVRKLCPKCRKEDRTTVYEMQMLGLTEPAVIYRAVGCPYCNHTGYFGRIGVFEIMIVNERVREMIAGTGFTSEKLNEYLRTDMQSLEDSAKQRILNGETTLEEYERLVDVV